MPPNGFGHEPGVLNSVGRELRAAATTMNTAATSDVSAPDAGDSSAEVGEALKRVVAAGAASGQTLADVAGGVDSAKGAYANIDNTNAGLLELSKRGHIDFPKGQSGPLLDAPDRPTNSPTARRR